ncbi:hypothetical protein TREMEDRAFT_40147 [Tremella mesenterica DSM 1558]|uniref:uncharacterized protein n=1 Tax=Tremella mesenterica (strain ATCC 24925 / CBS 8224 / DSM 1558 / NBRC 9311 / NRRL Y-6157 / RJB 2259-6 / UBC 559-6) TaxID=578456 RepID=UPI0003F4A0D9|nr:uncharacterized protein TREMEDRAFT_40147 [Tremella mesenterica DSM 1558]EIW68059.1 hypothetical protein TREMEDRAFT_40147 [Tremella mesenterica DSM 1558]
MMDEEEDNEGYDGEIIIGAPPEEMEEGMDVEREDNSWGVTSLHASGQSVFTISVHPLFPSPPLAISGGEDDLGYIFCPLPPSSTTDINSETFPPIKLTGHTDSVVAVGWSHDGEMVATGGMDGRVRVWRRVGKDGWKIWEFLTSLETGSEVVWLQWHPKGPVLAVGCEDAQVWMFNLPSGQTMAVLSSHTLSSTAGLFPNPAKSLLTSSLDSSLILWDPRSPTPIWKTSIFVPPNSPELDPAIHGITSLAVSPNGQIAAVGGAAGGVRLVNLAKGNVLNTLVGHAEGESVEALQFIDLFQGAGGGKGVVLISGGTDGKGFVWDVNTGRVRAEIQHEEPITSLAPHPPPKVHLITSASADSTLKTWDVRTGVLVAEHKGHAGVVNGVCVAPAPVPAPSSDSPDESVDSQVVVSAGDDGVSLIWRI